MINIIWWKCLLLIALSVELSTVRGSFGGSKHVRDEDATHSNFHVHNAYIHDSRQSWKITPMGPFSSEWTGKVACDTLDEILGFMSLLVDANVQALKLFSTYDFPTEKRSLNKIFMENVVDDYENNHFKDSDYYCSPERVSHDHCDRTFPIEQEDSVDAPEQLSYSDGIWRAGSMVQTKTELILPYNLTGSIPRRDPLSAFKIYKGGFNVTNLHYWSSASYTGCWGIILACICLTGSIFYGILSCWGWLGKRRLLGGQHEDLVSKDKPTLSILPLIFIISFFSLVAIGAAVVMYCGNKQLDKHLKATGGTLIEAADGVQFEINHALQMVQVATMFPITEGGGSSQLFLQTCFTLGRVFNRVQQKVKHNKEKVYRLFDQVKIALTVVSISLIAVAILGTTGTVGKWRKVIIWTFSLMTILVFASWLLAGLSFALTNVANDACMVMGDYEQNTVNSSLAKLLPCLSKPTATKIFSGAKAAIKNLVAQANTAIDWANRQEQRIASEQDSTVQFYLPRVCDPYGPPPSFDDRPCSKGEAPFINFQKVYGIYRCENDNITYCFERGTPVPDFIYLKASLAMNASGIMYKTLPSIFKIVTCNFVKVTLENIMSKHCKPLTRSMVELWVSFLVASLGMMTLQVCWMFLISKKGLSVGRTLRFTPQGVGRRPDDQVRNVNSPMEGLRRPHSLHSPTEGLRRLHGLHSPMEGMRRPTSCLQSPVEGDGGPQSRGEIERPLPLNEGIRRPTCCIQSPVEGDGRPHSRGEIERPLPLNE